MNRLTAVVVAYESAHVLAPCLDALKGEGVAAIVVDNASDDDTAAIAEGRGARVLRNRVNEGYGRANNRGVRAAASELVLIINPDMVLDAGAGALLLEAADRYPDAAILAPRIVEPDGRFFFHTDSLLSRVRRSNDQPLPEGDCCAPFLSGSCLLIRRELFLKLGGFDEAIFLFYEDDDLCRRVADAGCGLVHVHAAVARHGRGRSSAAKPGRAYNARWHQAWSQAYVARKYGLRNPAAGVLAVNAAKWALARLTGPGERIGRYGGSAAGALAFLRGQTALARQMLQG